MMSKNNYQSSRGFALIEVLVSLVIFTLGVVGLVGMQTRALQASTDAQDRNIAALLANSLTSEMWVVKSTAPGDSVVTAWKAQVEASLPNGEGDVMQNTAGTDATISVKWLSPTRKPVSSDPANPGGEEKNQFITKVVIPQ